MAHEQWPEGMIRDLSATKANFRNELIARNTVYNGMSAFMKSNGLNALSVKPIWGNPPQALKDRWAPVARQLNEEAEGVYWRGAIFYLSYTP